jgi:hypothetical protein
MEIISMAHANFLVIDVFLASLRSGAWPQISCIYKKDLLYVQKNPISGPLQTMSGEIFGYNPSGT